MLIAIIFCSYYKDDMAGEIPKPKIIDTIRLKAADLVAPKINHAPDRGPNMTVTDVLQNHRSYSSYSVDNNFTDEDRKKFSLAQRAEQYGKRHANFIKADEIARQRYEAQFGHPGLNGEEAANIREELDRYEPTSLPPQDVELRARYEAEYLLGEPVRVVIETVRDWVNDPSHRFEPDDRDIAAAKRFAQDEAKRFHVKDRDDIQRYEAAFYKERNLRQPGEQVQRDSDLITRAHQYASENTPGALKNNAFLKLIGRENVKRRYEAEFINRELSIDFQHRPELMHRYEPTPMIMRAARLSTDTAVELFKSKPGLWEKYLSEYGSEDGFRKFYEAEHVKSVFNHNPVAIPSEK